jgi:DNA-binding MarR family transcriptional regulator
MPLIRAEHFFDGQFTQIPNDWVRDGDLSLKARGLLALLMSHKPGWSVSVNSLIDKSKEGRDAIKSAVAELEAQGYLRREQEREDGGKFGEAIWITQTPIAGKPLTDKPLTDKPLTDKPHPKNTITKKTITKNTRENPPKGPTRIPEDFNPQPESVKAMVEHFPWVDVKLETHKFKDYWHAATKNAQKRDWDAAWRNWIRKAAEWKKPEQPKAKRIFGIED